jgi:hypothetical protein
MTMRPLARVSRDSTKTSTPWDAAAWCLVGGVAHGLGEFGDEALELEGVDGGEVELPSGGCGAGAGGDGGDVMGFVD